MIVLRELPQILKYCKWQEKARSIKEDRRKQVEANKEKIVLKTKNAKKGAMWAGEVRTIEQWDESSQLCIRNKTGLG